jgi:hypothetical protein
VGWWVEELMGGSKICFVDCLKQSKLSDIFLNYLNQQTKCLWYVTYLLNTFVDVAKQALPY